MNDVKFTSKFKSYKCDGTACAICSLIYYNTYVFQCTCITYLVYVCNFIIVEKQTYLSFCPFNVFYKLSYLTLCIWMMCLNANKVIIHHNIYIFTTIPHYLQQAILVQSTKQNFKLIKHVCVVSPSTKYIALNYIILHHWNECSYVSQNHIHQRRRKEAYFIVNF